MKHQTFRTTLGLGTLSIALIALPSSSAQKQDAASSTEKKIAERNRRTADCKQTISSEDELQSLKDRSLLLSNERAVASNFANPAEIIDGDDDDIQVVVNPGGGWLGVGVSEVNSTKMKELKLPEERGALLGNIVPDSPAAKAGLKKNDVVTEINGQRIEGSEQFRRMIREIPSGRKASLTVWRDGLSQTITATIGKPESLHMNHMNSVHEFPGNFSFNMPDLSGLENLHAMTLLSPGRPLLGIDAENLTGEFGKFFGAPEGEGVLVRSVFSNSPAAAGGVKVGDVIVSMDGERIHNASELREKLLTKKESQTLKLGIVRNKAEISLSVELPHRDDSSEESLSERIHI